MSKYYPSSAGFCRGDLVFTEYNSGCLRKILIANNGVREQLRIDTQQVGAANEDDFATAHPTYQRELKVQTDSDLGAFAGRVDFLSADEVIELKSTRSDSKRRRLRTDGPVVENIAQLVAYMVELERTHGRLIYTYYGVDKKTKNSIKEDFEFAVSVDQFGDLYVNGARFKFNVYDWLEHRVRVGSLGTALPPRPYGHDKPFGSPCKYCVFSTSCKKLDSGAVNTVQEFVEDARAVLASK